MDNNNRNRVYVDMMVDTLKKKKTILRFLYEKTKEQEELLKEKKLDVDAFERTVEEKGVKIDSLDEIDSGFDRLFTYVKKEITQNRDSYRGQILQMQKLIADVSDLGVSIQALENQNSTRFKAFLTSERKMIREFNVNSRTATNYYQNMTNANRPEQSYFFNEKK